jgi:hypothetical protein
MEYRRAETYKCGGDEHRVKIGSNRQQDHTGQRKCHSNGKRIRLRAAICVEADHRLQQRSGDLTGQRDETNLTEAQSETLLQDGINGRQQRLHHVVEQVAEAEDPENPESGMSIWPRGRPKHCLAILI